MKKLILSLVALSAAATALAQPPPVFVSPSVIRNHGDTVETGSLWIVTDTGGPPLPGCIVTQRGAGTIGNFALGAAHIHAMTVMAAWDGNALVAARDAQITAGGSGAFSVHFEDSFNFAQFPKTLEAAVIEDALIRVLLEGQGPLNPTPVWGNDIYNALADAQERGFLGQAAEILSAVRTENGVFTINQVADRDISMAGGAGLVACIGPTGQMRALDPGNNGSYAEECRPSERLVTLGSGGGLEVELNKALSNADINTFQATCNGVGGARAGAVTITGPLVLGLRQAVEMGQNHRIQQFFSFLPGFVQVHNYAPAGPKLSMKVE